MHAIFMKTFGGLSRPYYIRHFIFGLIFPTIFLLTHGHNGNPFMAAPATLGLLAANSILYPYSRFVYESVTGYIIGRNVFFISAPMMLFAKFMTMLLCWAFAIFIAPIGLLYLYIHHSRPPSH